jgi:ABC-2 type transport system ATP-binding protein
MESRAGMAIIETVNLRKVFRSIVRRPGIGGAVRALFSREYEDHVAVDDVTMSIEAGELVGYLGPNGAGKSTTIKMLTGILVPTSGAIRVAGLAPHEHRLANAANIGVVFGQRSQLYWDLPLRESFGLLRAIYDIPEDRYRANLDHFSEILDLERFMSTPVRQLSLGERMRGDFAAALLHDPKIVYLDEPTIGLDVVAKQQIRAVVRDLNQDEGATVLLTSHDAGDIEQVCRRVIVINRGALVFDDAVVELKRAFLRHKVIEVKLGEERPPPDLPGVTVIAAEPYRLRLEVDPDAQPIERLIASLAAGYRIVDLTVEEPPLEEIIAAIYVATGRVAAGS